MNGSEHVNLPDLMELLNKTKAEEAVFTTIPRSPDGMMQLLFLMFVYGYVLLTASKLIADGSEMLMLILNPGVIGGLVLPVMGAVPDGAMVLVRRCNCF